MSQFLWRVDVSWIGADIDEDNLRQHFAPFNPINVSIENDGGFYNDSTAIVNFATSKEAETAQLQLDQSQLHSITLSVKLFNKKYPISSPIQTPAIIQNQIKPQQKGILII
ncbi:MAG: hypothetical protein EZS28_011347 [Streblomastix strix]|uniref:RRM domain-containing protein n=1 Tax=Streblomastix strix TaxID=222440 RepID=A0A5J4WDT4_9EUKA|nr:MAG: hypothetical protein EZS28_011347 [Streblomastix strix]